MSMGVYMTWHMYVSQRTTFRIKLSLVMSILWIELRP